MSAFHVSGNVQPRRSPNHCTGAQPVHHTDVTDADQRPLANGALNEDDGSFLWAYRSGHTSDAQKRLDPALIHVEVIGQLAICLYDSEVCAIGILTSDGDVYLESERWFQEIVRAFLGKVSL